MTQNSDTFLGFDKKQIPLLSLLLAGLIMLAGMFYQVNSNINALRADMNALRAEMNANDIAHRADIRALDSRVDALTVEVAKSNVRIDVLSVEAAETNARIENIERRVENIERSLPDYASVDERLDDLERDQARIADLEREQARLIQLVNALSNAE